jgi:protocatechuate 3,4-dioxygenase beta subunit
MSATRQAGFATAAAALWLLAAVGGLESAQRQPLSRPGATGAQKPPPPTGAIRGRVTSIQSGDGLPRARILVSSTAISEPRVVLTTAEGRFSVFELPAGRYTVAAYKSGFVAESYSEAGDGHATAIDLADGEQRRDVSFALAPEGVVSGRVLDEDGTPFQGARVEVLRPHLETGQRVLLAIGSAFSDDRGQFRIGGLRAGLHYVSAADPAFDSVGDAGGRLTYSPTYHPGVTFPEEATQVRVEAGREVSAIEFRLRLVRPVRVNGRISAADERQLLAGAVVMTSQHGERLSPVPVKDVTIFPDGVFQFRNVTPGRYVIRARGETERQGVSLFGSFAASIDAGDLNNIHIPLTPGAVAEGRIDLETTRGTPLVFTAAIRVRAVASDGVVFGDAFSDAISTSGQFAFRGIMPGDHVFRVEGLPSPWVLKGVYWRGREITDTPVYLEAGRREQNFSVVLTDARTTITGTVRDRGGEPRADSTVVVFSIDPGTWRPYSRHVQIARPDLGGVYRIDGLPPGEYWIAPTQEIESGDVLNPASLERLAARAGRVTLGPGETRSLDLQIGTKASQTGFGAAAPTRQP